MTTAWSNRTAIATGASTGGPTSRAGSASAAPESAGWTLARAHAQSGDPVAIAEYPGDDDTFDWAISDFSERYADQNEEDYAAFCAAIRSGRIEALEGV